MAKPDVEDENGPAALEDLESLCASADALARTAEAAAERYDRTMWLKYVGVFFPVPFVVVLFRTHMQASHYYVAGALFLAAMVVIYAVDFVAAEKLEGAIQAAERARNACAFARSRQESGDAGAQDQPLA